MDKWNVGACVRIQRLIHTGHDPSYLWMIRALNARLKIDRPIKLTNHVLTEIHSEVRRASRRVVIFMGVQNK